MWKASFGLSVFLMLLCVGGEWLSDQNPPLDETASPPKEVKEHTFRAGDTLFGALSVWDVPPQEIIDISKAAHGIYNLKKVIPGQKMRVFLSEAPRAVSAIFYQIDPFRMLKLIRSDRGFQASEQKSVLDLEVRTQGGIIVDSLSASARRYEVPYSVILHLADVFSWDIDFNTQIQSGDRFQIVYEVFKRGNAVVSAGRILAAEVVNDGRSHRAYYFAPPGEGEGAASADGDYYDTEGRPLRKTFLKSPLRYRYVTSGFTPWRWHPILKTRRAHLGVDYAAPYGTPVMAAADGIVTYIGWQGGYGKTIMIQHRYGYRTLYGHLSNYSVGIGRGKKVRQGDFIGVVGSTGLSTGPHLHYTLFKNGHPIDPRRSEVAYEEALPQKWQADFRSQVQTMDRYF